MKYKEGLQRETWTDMLWFFLLFYFSDAYTWRIHFIHRIYGFSYNCICGSRNRTCRSTLKGVRPSFDFVLLFFTFMWKESSTIFRPYLLILVSGNLLSLVRVKWLLDDLNDLTFSICREELQLILARNNRWWRRYRSHWIVVVSRFVPGALRRRIDVVVRRWYSSVSSAGRNVE